MLGRGVSVCQTLIFSQLARHTGSKQSLLHSLTLPLLVRTSIALALTAWLARLLMRVSGVELIDKTYIGHAVGHYGREW